MFVVAPVHVLLFLSFHRSWSDPVSTVVFALVAGSQEAGVAPSFVYCSFCHGRVDRWQ